MNINPDYWRGLSWEQWCEIWDSQGTDGFREHRWRLYDLHEESEPGSEGREFARRGVEEINRIERRRNLHFFLREMLMTARPDISADVLIDALIEVERMRFDLDLEREGSFQDNFKAALEVAEARAETARKGRDRDE
jgi:hypothetical protein